jgi:dienelactone hydrolase
MRHADCTFRCLCLAIAWYLSASCGWGAEPAFRRHEINAQSNYSACAAIDVNGDGKLDVVAGGWWYEAPTWQRHFVRDVEMIRGRYDDYSNLPLDVNGDGRLDLVSVNYRSSSLYWVEQPSDPTSESREWKKHVIDTPGPMETGRLVDIDGDGQLDVLPNGTQFAAWWELVREKTASGAEAPRWIRRDLPKEVAGHGVGFGDINGDGRGDFVSPRGWLEAPEDRRKGRWIWHADFELHRDASIPILVLDVDGDGDGDVVWGRGHNIGLYWLEQVTGDDGSRRWVHHAIDTSWSQPHSLLLADIDNDGRDELIAGKRYMGHDGKDPGEHDPLMAYWYKFDKTTRAWQRGAIQAGGPAGFGLDPKAVDLDGDGDIDILASDLCGLYWFENLLIRRDGDTAGATEPEASPAYEDHSKLLVYKDAAGAVQPVKSLADWAQRRAHILAGMQTVMGELPDSSRRVPLDVQVVEEVAQEKYVRRKITFAAEPGDRVPAYLLIPKDLRGKAPAMLCLHQTTSIGKGEPAGLGGRPTLHYAHELAERGFVCIVPDYPSFGDYPYDFKKQGSHYASGSMKAIWNNVRAIDVLESLPEVDADRIGCIGHSLGGHNSLFTAAFDQRLRAVVSSCGFTAFHHYYDGKLAGWTSDRYMPRIRDDYGNDPDRVPFDFYEVVGALAPRPFFTNSPVGDSNFDVAGVKKIEAAASEVYSLLGAKDKLRFAYPQSAHDFPDEVRREAYEWLDRQLK